MGVVDDEATRLTLRRWLRHLQVRGQVLEATDGQEALALIATQCQATTPSLPLLVLLDLKMPAIYFRREADVDAFPQLFKNEEEVMAWLRDGVAPA